MSTPQEDFQNFLNEQRAEYERALPGKMAEIGVCWGAVNSSGEAAQPLRDLERLAHTLAGTAGTLGFHETGAAARVLELLLEQAGEVGPALTPAQRSDIAQAITALQASLPAG